MVETLKPTQARMHRCKPDCLCGYATIGSTLMVACENPPPVASFTFASITAASEAEREIVERCAKVAETEKDARTVEALRGSILSTGGAGAAARIASAIRALPVSPKREEEAATDTPPRGDIKAQADTVKEAEAWLRAISTWLLETNNDMCLPAGVLDGNPLDIADRLGGWVCHDGGPDAPHDWRGGDVRLISGGVIRAPKLAVRWGRVEAYIPRR